MNYFTPSRYVCGISQSQHVSQIWGGGLSCLCRMTKTDQKSSEYLRKMHCQWNIKPNSQRLNDCSSYGTISWHLNSHYTEMSCIWSFQLWKTTSTKGDTYDHGKEINVQAAFILKNTTGFSQQTEGFTSPSMQGDFATIFQRTFYVLWISDHCFLFPNVPSSSRNVLIKVYTSEHINFHLTIGTRQWGVISVTDKKILHITQWT